MKNKGNKKEEAITLIALVITIIILLILAGVSIAMLTGNNGILIQSKLAKENTTKAAQKENEDLIELEMIANNSIANIPNLKEGMIPVKWDTSRNTWVVADKNNTGNDWYDYSTSSKKWANVVTVKENCSDGKTRTDYLSAGVGTPIPEDDITTMFVWIPRYSYYVKSGYHENANGTGEFAIKFLVGTSDRIVDAPEEQEKAIRTSDTNGETNGGKYVVHPAFTADTDLGGTGSELSGIWVGKFESSNVESPKNNEGITKNSSKNMKLGQGDNKKITIRPNVTSWRMINVVDMFNISKNMSSDTGKLYGFNSSETTTTMMQNSQWGAVAYLAQSEYGNMQKSDDSESGIWNNSYNEGFIDENVNESTIWNYSTTMTGMSSTSRDVGSSYYSKLIEGSKKDNGDSIEISYVMVKKETTTESNYTTIEGEKFRRTYYRYYTENGQKASTTRNIYGIYDMSGGAWENVANCLKKEETDYYISGFLKLDKKDQTMYEQVTVGNSSEDRIKNYNKNENKYGDALWETSNSGNEICSWNSDNSFFPCYDNPFFIRGSDFDNVSNAGIFSFNSRYGSRK